MTTPDIGVVVVTHNSAEVVDTLLDSLPAAMGDLTHRVVVVDNASSDDTLQVLRRRDVTVVASGNRGYAAGINTGVERLPAESDVLVLNPDVVLDPGSVARMVRRLADPTVGIVAPRMLDGDGELTPSLRREPTILRAIGLGFTGWPPFAEDIWVSDLYDRPAVAGWATGAVLLVRRECHDRLGGWDERFFLYSEETDFSIRARQHGWQTVYEPTAVARHIGSHSGWNDRLYTMQILNRVRVYGLHHSAAKAWVYFGVAALRELAYAVRGHARSRLALTALLRPGARPAELGLGGRFRPWEDRGSGSRPSADRLDQTRGASSQPLQ